jgi:putative transposase
MMLDRDLVAVSPSTTYRVLKDADLLQPWNLKPTKKGTGFVQPIQPHEHWHVDFSYINIVGTFYYLCSVLDGCSRAVLSWDICFRSPSPTIRSSRQPKREFSGPTNLELSC